MVYRAWKKKTKGEPLKQKGGQTCLTADEEKCIVKCVEAASEWGYPLGCFDLRMIIQSYLNEIGKTVAKFKNNCPGPDFAYAFAKQHKDRISGRMCQNIKRARARVTPTVINEYFDNLAQELDGVPACNIVNYDETNLSDDPGRKKVLAKRGLKYVERVMNHSKSATSIMYAASADGVLLPVYVVYKAKHLYDSWTEGGPANARYNRTDSGWFDAHCFSDWLEHIAIPYFRRFGAPGKKFLIGDNLSSHLSYQAIRLCMKADIHFIFLPSSSTHLTQPLDVAFFRPVKGSWRTILTNWKRGAGESESTVPKAKFPRLLKELHKTIAENASVNIKSGFKATGIFPLNRQHVLRKLPPINETDMSPEAIEGSFERYLRKLRFPSTSTQAETPTNTSITQDTTADTAPSTSAAGTSEPLQPTPRRKKKVNIAPGKSVSEADVLLLEAEALNNAQRRCKRKRIPVDVHSDDSGKEDDPEAVTAERGRPKKCKKIVPKRGRPKENVPGTDTLSNPNPGQPTEEIQVPHSGPPQCAEESSSPVPMSTETVSCFSFYTHNCNGIDILPG